MRASVSIPFALSMFVALSVQQSVTSADAFHANWSKTTDRVWVGPEFWGNRLHDWRIHDGRLECVAESSRLSMRTLHLLTHRLGIREGEFEISVRTGVLGDDLPAVNARSAAGFLIGVGGLKMDYRAAALVHGFHGPGAGIFAGVSGTGEVFIRDIEKVAPAGQAKLPVAVPRDVLVTLKGAPTDDGQFRLEVSSLDPESNEVLGCVSSVVEPLRTAGNIALVSHPGGVHGTRYWFQDWTVKGTKIDVDDKRVFGPVACIQYTLSQNITKLTAQMMPLGDDDPNTVRLETKQGDQWQTVAKAAIIKPGFTAPFRVEDWESSDDVPYRVACDLKDRDGVVQTHTLEGVIRKDPVDKETIVVAGFTGNHNNSHKINRRPFDWTSGMWFPHQDLTERVAKHSPDVLFFSGDQVYEGASPSFPDTANIKLDYLYKWYLWCWAYRDLTKEIPCVTIPDDHDVYQGNIWGEGGRKTDRDHFGGYVHPADFAKMVERTQTSHLPDPYDPTPIEQGIGVYYTGMTYGRISFAIIEDRKFKSGCAGRLPPTGTARPDHINNPDFDVRRADVPGVKLLGDRQLDFLTDWAADWRGADMKMALSQTVFANMATHHGANLQYLLADLDSNGWPQTGRNKALRALRKGFAFHLCGDQHLATIVQHGIDQHRDGPWSFAVPSIANFYPRMWLPKAKGKNRPSDSPPWKGDHLDGLRNFVTVYAATNPGESMGHEPADLHDKMPGYGIVKLNKKERTITMECWPRFADPLNPDHEQYDGWPRTIKQTDNYARPAVAHLPTIRVEGLIDPVLQVIDQTSSEVVYTLRIKGTSVRPKVFKHGYYTVRIGNPDSGPMRRLKDVPSLRKGKSGTVTVDFEEEKE